MQRSSHFALYRFIHTGNLPNVKKSPTPISNYVYLYTIMGIIFTKVKTENLTEI